MGPKTIPVISPGDRLFFVSVVGKIGASVDAGVVIVLFLVMRTRVVEVIVAVLGRVIVVRLV